MQRKIYFIMLTVLVFYWGNGYGQNRMSYADKDTQVEFEVSKEKFYITFDTSYIKDFEINRDFKTFNLILENSAIITLNDNHTELNSVINFLKRNFGEKINTIDVVLEYEDGTEQLNSDEIIVKVKNIDILKNFNITKDYQLDSHGLITDVYILKFSDVTTFDIFNIVTELNRSNEIIYAEPNFIRLLKPSEDPYLNSQWSIENNGYLGGVPNADMNVKEAWNFATGLGIKVAVLDEGVQLNHPDLVANLLPGYDATGGGSAGGSANNDNHGTACAGIIAAVKNDIGVRGVAYDSKIIPVRIAYKNSWGGWVTYDNWIATSLTWAKNSGADVISNSWGGGSNSSLINNAIIDCVDNGRNGKGCVVLFSSGNGNNSTILYPSSHSKAIAVGASSMCDERKSLSSCDNETWWGSNYGTGLSVVAPGVKIYTTDNYSGYKSDFNGTSAACPNAAGVAALILSVNPNFTQTQVRNILESTTKKIQTSTYNYQTLSSYPNGTWSTQAGYGRLDAFKAVIKAICLTNPSSSLDLYIKDYYDDSGEEPNTITEHTWRSRDIWVRHINDGQLWHQNPEYDPNLPNYVYVRVINKSCVASSGDDILKVYWSKAATAMTWQDHWNGSTFPTGQKRGDFIGQANIPIIQSGEEAIVVVEWNNIPNPESYTSINPEPWHFCLLARIESDDDQMTSTETTATGANVRNNNNIAQKNITIVDVNPNSGGRLGGVIAVGNPFGTTRNFTLNLVADNRETGKKIFEEAEVSITLDQNFLTVWKNGGKQGNNIIQRDETTLIITGDNASLNNLTFDADEFATLYLKFNFLTQEITEKELFTYHVIQKESSSNEVIGGETYEIYKDPRALFFADAGNNKQVDKNESVTFSAETLNEPALYNWYDSEGNLVYEGASFTTSVEIAKTYKLEIIALADGYKDYSEVEVSLKPNSIKTMYPNPVSDEVTVSYKINQGNSAYLAVTGFYGSNISNNYILDIEENGVTLDVSSYPQGLYSIALIVNGQIQDTTTLIKQ